MRRRPIETTAVAAALREILHANAEEAAEENVLIARDEAGDLHPYLFALQKRMRQEGGPGTRIRVDALVERGMAEAMKVWEQVNPKSNARDHRWLALDEVAAVTTIDAQLGSLTEQALVRARAQRDDSDAEPPADLRAFFDAFDWSRLHQDSLPGGQRVDARPGQAGRDEPPATVIQAFDFYYRIEAADVGAVSLHRAPIAGRSLWLVYTTTDGDDAYAEVLDTEGTTVEGLRLMAGQLLGYDEFVGRVRLARVFLRLVGFAHEEGLSEADERAAAGQPPSRWPGDAVLDGTLVHAALGGDRHLGRIDFGALSLTEQQRQLGVAAIEQLWELPLRQQIYNNQPVGLGPQGQGVLSVGSFTRPTDGKTYEVANYRDIDDASFVYYFSRDEHGLRLAILQFDN